MTGATSVACAREKKREEKEVNTRSEHFFIGLGMARLLVIILSFVFISSFLYLPLSVSLHVPLCLPSFPSLSPFMSLSVSLRFAEALSHSACRCANQNLSHLPGARVSTSGTKKQIKRQIDSKQFRETNRFAKQALGIRLSYILQSLGGSFCTISRFFFWGGGGVQFWYPTTSTKNSSATTLDICG